ncbi:ABC transporter ATP-binding protein [Rhizohabitans arisaemae]|uniref:ABC transporter ATP-binding protein n=1 Tax=Rhizohabitans arisaemae TaxID=2720610 RepID=UPI0024B1D7FE|nr:ABC transporter ATP-binding protein [Rhizohabitans arisaemae]
MTHTTTQAPAPADAGPGAWSPGGVRIEVTEVSRAAGGRRVLDGVTLSVRPGQVVVIVGLSGAGKTTLLSLMAGFTTPSEGEVRHDGGPIAAGASVGYVPQDDIVHRELPLARTLAYAARLRLPVGTEIEPVVAKVLAELDLERCAGTRIGALSGGERKRASIGTELLTRPRAFFLDEPTSGLDPATAAELMGTLRDLADGGATVVLTSHSPSDVRHCDTVIVLNAGRLAYAGPPEEVCAHFGVFSMEEVYLRLGGAVPDGDRTADAVPCTERACDGRRPQAPPPAGRHPGVFRQWALLSRRNLDILRRNRLTLAILAGSPLMVLGMFALLFRPGAFDPADPSPSATVQILFWIAFGGFFFGLTYGLLQICTELPVLRRERFVGLKAGPYVLAKVTVLLPLLLVVDAAMLAVLGALDRLPDGDAVMYAELFTTLVLSSAAALALGLLVSASVSDPSQAALALPMACFPQVLFVGAILPVPLMATGGQVMSLALSNRWAFEALGHSAQVERLWAEGASPLGPPLLMSYGDSFARPLVVDWALLGLFTVGLLLITRFTVARRSAA